MICRKCNSPGKLIIRKEYCYCVDCFNININHKFRACIGKNKIISANDKILICLSGDSNSTVLLDLIHTGISLNNHKKLRIIPSFLHVVENDAAEYIKNSVIEQCKKYNFDVKIVHIKEYTQNKHLFNPNNTSINHSEGLINENNLPATIKYDVKKKLKQSIFLEIAKKLQCKIIFTAETTTILATRLLSNLAIGRGSQVENDIGFVDSRDEFVKILRPMKDVSSEEVEHYIKINLLNPTNIKDEKENSLQSVIQNFVLDLQENFPATISTICKTADKMSSNDNVKCLRKCRACQSAINTNHSSLTAVDGTMFSKKVSLYKCGEESNIDDVLKNEDNTMFPFIYDGLCYCCSRNYAELQDSKQKTNI